MKYLLQFEEPGALSLDVAGGKGANLARLTQNGFPVPPGFIVSVQAYRDFIQGGSGWLRRVPAFSFDDPAALRRESEQLRTALAALTLPELLVEEVRAQLVEHPWSFAVRSSSTLEDLAGAAFAGQHDTFLNCKGADAILEKIKVCFLSLWEDRALAYRQQHGFDHGLAAMAVVVQQMVFCEVAGVAFSLNPVSGKLDELVVDANFGLGESVVSGEGEIDHWELDKASGRSRRASVARKSRKVVAVPGGTQTVAIPAAEATLPSLSEAGLQAVNDLVRQVERHYRFPQDVEWGVDAGRLWLLQARPITAIPARWTRDESAERFPNAVTPLTWDFVDAGFHRSLGYSLRLMGLPAFPGKWFGMHHHYIYGNQNAVELYLHRPPFVASSLAELKAVIPRLREEFRWVQELPLRWSRDLDHYLIRLGEFMAEPLAPKDLAGVWDYVLRVNEHGTLYFQPNIAISMAHGWLYHTLHRLLQMVFGQEAERLFDGVLGFCETKTGVINRELFELAQQIRSQPELERRLLEQPSRPLVEEGHLTHFPAFHQRFQKLLGDHGHREVDFDMYHPTWLEAPWVVLDNLRLILRSPMDLTPAQQERELKLRAQQAEVQMFQGLPPDLHFFFYEVVRLARVYTSLDDLEHYHTTRLALPMRRGLRELGRRLMERSRLADPMDIYFCRWQSLEQAIRANERAGWQELAAAVRTAKAAYLADRDRKPPWNLGGESTEESAGGNCLTGLPGSPGQAEGPVCLVSSADDFARFPKGAVLVARTTHPTWTPLFYSASAVITESGGPLSHGAVTAREMQIPAVMSVHDALVRLKNGQRVRVEGNQGKVFLC